MNEKIYTIEEIKNCIFKILKKYGIEKAYLFGSYARNEANKNSDIDIRRNAIKDDIRFNRIWNRIKKYFEKRCRYN